MDNLSSQKSYDFEELKSKYEFLLKEAMFIVTMNASPKKTLSELSLLIAKSFYDYYAR